ncbi:MAG: cytochrome c-type biogenesis CcmF C-terminal domain-containing protein, partial [Flavobacteriales bacterium]
LVSAAQITYQTSVPVFNTFLEPLSGLLQSGFQTTGWEWMNNLSKANLAPTKDIELAYHRVQVPLAFLAILLVAVTQFFKWKNSDIKQVGKKLLRSFIAAVVISALLLLAYPFEMREFPLIALLFACVFAILSNLDYLFLIMKGKFNAWGSSIAHIGFALVILGALISTGKKEFVSRNQIGDISTLNKEMSNSEDMLLLQNDTIPMGDYYVSYRERKKEDNNLLFVIDYFNREPVQYKVGDLVYRRQMMFEATADHESTPEFDIESVEKYWRIIPIPNKRQVTAAKLWVNGQAGEHVFTLEPRIQLNEIMGNSPEPDTKHYLNRDLYTHIKWGRIEPPKADESGYLEGKAHN